MIGARVAVAPDVEELTELVRLAAAEALAKRGGPEWDRYDRYRREPIARELTDDIATGQRCQVVCGTIDGAVVGYATVVRVDTLARMVELFTHPRARSVGVGAAMLQLVSTMASHWGCTELESVALPGDRDTKNFFESHAMKSRLLVVGRRVEANADDDRT